MTSTLTTLAVSLLPFGMAFGAFGLPINGEDTRTANLRPNCELSIEVSGGHIVLEGLVFSRRPASGSYRLQVSQESGGGSSEIVQSGDFVVETGLATSLGTVSLLDGVKNYTADLTVSWDDGAADCFAEAPKILDEESASPEYEPPSDLFDQGVPK